MVTIKFPYNVKGLITKHSSLIKGYILFKKGYVKVGSAGYVKVKSERCPDERPYILRFIDEDWKTVRCGCGAKATNPNLLCKHEIAGIFAKFPNVILSPNEKIVEIFKKYKKNNFPSSVFDTDVWLYAKEINIRDEKLADYLWFCYFARLVTEKRVRMKKSALEPSLENLILAGKYLTARMKALFSYEKKQDDTIFKAINQRDGKNLNEIISNCEEEGIKNPKAIIYRAFEEGLLLHKKIKEAYLKAYPYCSDLNLVL